jgi:hypothetical protein
LSSSAKKVVIFLRMLAAQNILPRPDLGVLLVAFVSYIVFFNCLEKKSQLPLLIEVLLYLPILVEKEGMSLFAAGIAEY